jgi:hypothetical protein
MEAALTDVDLGTHEMLVGVDGCLRGRATHLQTVMHLQGEPHPSLAKTTVKLYPTKEERATLAGWRLCEAQSQIPNELTLSRRVRTAAGTVLVLVCNDATIFLGRSRSNIKSDLRLAIRRHFMEQALAEPRPEYVLIATHWHGTNPKTGRWWGDTFRQAADYLTSLTGATVVTTMRAPLRELSTAAHRFGVIGQRADKVATLLVQDTFEE